MIKKLIFLGLVALSLIFTNLSFAKSFSYRWENTYIEVPIQESIYNYSSLPTAYLYSDGMKLSNTQIIYNRTGDWLYYLKDVNTSKPGEYKVWYKASELNYNPGTCENYKQLITFKVIDNIAPKIELLQTEASYPVNSDPLKLDFNKLFRVIDNLADTKISVNYDSIDFKTVGYYSLYISAIDSSGNQDNKELKVHIADNIGPVVNFLGKEDKITFEYGKEMNFKSYFRAIDNIDGDVTDSIQIEGFDSTKIGLNKNVKISFSDSEGNKTFKYLDVLVVDLILPVLTLNQEQITMEYQTEFKEELFRKYINEANDNGISLLDSVKIDFSSLENKVGSYIVSYTVFDSDNNKAEASLKVNLVSLVKPTIVTENVTIKVGETIDFSKYYKISDESDPNCKDNVKIEEGSFDNLTPGIYYITVTCFNSSGLFNHGVIEVNVIAENKLGGGFMTPERIIILILVLLILGFALTYYLMKRKKQKSLIDMD